MLARILVIEDNAPNLELMTYLITAFGHMPLTAANGVAGLEVARRERPDLIVCDIQLPGMDGYEVARHLKSDPQLLSVPLVAVTAYAMVGDREKVLAAGFDGYIPKPIAPGGFVHQLEGFLHRRPRRSRAAETPVTEATPSGPPVVLAVDNIPASLELLRSVLTPHGYQVIGARKVSTALSRARRRPPDLILCDLHMPDSSGFALLEQLKADPALRAIPLIFLTAVPPDESEHAYGLALGARRFLVRPLKPLVILSEVQSLLPPGRPRPAGERNPRQPPHKH